MILPLIRRILRRSRTRSLTPEGALEHVETIASYADMLAATPVASTAGTHDALRDVLPALIRDLSPDRAPVRIASISKAASNTVEVRWMRHGIGFRISRNDVQLLHGDRLVLAFTLPGPFGDFAERLALYLLEDAGRRPSPQTVTTAKRLAERLHLAFSEILAGYSDERRRTRNDATLLMAQEAATCVAAAIEAERPDSMGSVFANLEQRSFLASLKSEDDSFGCRIPVVAPRHLTDMLPGHALLVATSLSVGEIALVNFDDNWVESAELPKDPVQMVRLARLHGADLFYGASIDAAHAADSLEKLP